MSRPGTAVTVVIPVWDDYVRWLPDAIASVRRNATDVQIVIVDNASTTDVPVFEGCELIRSDERLTVGAARNRGLERVTTEFVLVLDADDSLLDGALEFLCSRAAANPSVSIEAMSILDEATGERHRTPRRFVASLVRWSRTFALANSIWSLLPIQGCAILRTQEARDAGGYPDADLGDDWVLGVSLAWRGRVELSRRLGRYYRVTQGSISGREWSSRELRANARLVRERMRRDAGVPAWARAALPAIALLQLAAIYLLRPTFRAAGRLRGGARSIVR